MRTARGNHLTVVWQAIRIGMLAAPAILTMIGLYKSVTAPVAAESESSALLTTDSETPIVQPLTYNEGNPAPSSPADNGTVSPANAQLQWSATGFETVQDTYNLRYAASSTINADTKELSDSPTIVDGLTEAHYMLPAQTDGDVYWQVQSCDTLGCGEWSTVWKMTIDGTAPAAPDASVTSSIHNQTVRFSGMAEAGSTVKMTIQDSDATCQTVADQTGAWACTLGSELDFGTYSAVVTAIDAAGNVSPATQVDVTVSELFVAPVITSEELAPTIDVVPITVAPINKVAAPQTAQSTIDVVKNVNQGSSDAAQAAIKPLSTEGGIIRSSSSGWQVLGLPWFVWLGSLTGLGSGWLAMGKPTPRRLGNLLSV